MTFNNISLAAIFIATRQQSVDLSAPLATEDFGLQAAPFASPPKWHLAHTSWFFETFILKPFAASYKIIDPVYEVLFNSYYNGVGEQFPRAQRGLLSRPTVAEIIEYRQHVDRGMMSLLQNKDHPHSDTIINLCQLGVQHEKQHQELFCTDLKYSLSVNPLFPAYLPKRSVSKSSSTELKWLHYGARIAEIGVESNEEIFSYDNESPKHKVYLDNFCIADRLITNDEYQAFIDDGGYQKSEFWLADGWIYMQQHNWLSPLYWHDTADQAMEFTLFGLEPRDPHQAVCHISAYEADAYAKWAGARLPTEAEWEFACCQQRSEKSASLTFHPQIAKKGLLTKEKNTELLQLFDTCWQWTSSAYRPYPGFKAAKGATGEYNGKFMCNQWVLRGGSCVSPDHHLRSTYRNFFYPHERWQFSGLRLAK